MSPSIFIFTCSVLSFCCVRYPFILLRHLLSFFLSSPSVLRHLLSFFLSSPSVVVFVVFTALYRSSFSSSISVLIYLPSSTVCHFRIYLPSSTPTFFLCRSLSPSFFLSLLPIVGLYGHSVATDSLFLLLFYRLFNSMLMLLRWVSCGMVQMESHERPAILFGGMRYRGIASFSFLFFFCRIAAIAGLAP